MSPKGLHIQYTTQACTIHTNTQRSKENIIRVGNFKNRREFFFTLQCLADVNDTEQNHRKYSFIILFHNLSPFSSPSLLWKERGHQKERYVNLGEHKHILTVLQYQSLAQSAVQSRSSSLLQNQHYYYCLIEDSACQFFTAGDKEFSVLLLQFRSCRNADSIREYLTLEHPGS